MNIKDFLQYSQILKLAHKGLGQKNPKFDSRHFRDSLKGIYAHTHLGINKNELPRTCTMHIKIGNK